MPTSGNKSTKPLPFRYTIRIASIKYFKGLNTVIACAHSGILLIGVNNPLSKAKMIKKKNAVSIACCCVDEKEEIAKPNPVKAIKYTAANK